MTTKAAHQIFRKSRTPFTGLLTLILVCIGDRAFAASAGMPWEGPIMQLVSSLTGPVAKGIGIVAIAAAGLGMALSESGHAMKKLIGIILGLSIAFTAGSFGISLLGFSGGLAL